MTTRDRLLLAFANLASYGIESRAAFGTCRQDGRQGILDGRRSPHSPATEYWAFWTAPDDEAFTGAGELWRPLVVHCSTEDVVRAVLAACIQEHIVTEAGDTAQGLIVSVCPDSQRSLDASRRLS